MPLIASNLFQIVISQISLVIIARKSTDALAAVTMIDNFLYSFGGVLGAISLAFNIYGAKALGEKDQQKLGSYIASIFYLSITIGAIFMLVLLFFGRPIIKGIYGFHGETLVIATTYTFIMSPYILVTLLIFVFTNLLKIEKKTNKIFSISVFCALLQASLSYVLINGKGPIPPMGVLGSGIASMLSLIVMVLLYLLLLKNLVWRSLKYRPTKLKFLFIKSIPLMLQECFEGVIFIIAFEGVVTHLGLTISATYAIINQGLMMAKLPTLMYGNAVTVFASQSNGEKNDQNILRVGQITFLSSLLAYGGITVSIWIFRDSFFHLFTNDQAIFQLMPSMLPLMFLGMAVTPLYEIAKYLLQSLELSSLVLGLTASCNMMIMFVIFVLWQLDVLSFPLLYGMYGLNFFILGLFFTWVFRGHMKNSKVTK